MTTGRWGSMESTMSDARDERRTLLVASTGGHLEQLMRLHERLRPASNETEWVTSDEPQSRSLLSGQRVQRAGMTSTPVDGAVSYHRAFNGGCHMHLKTVDYGGVQSLGPVGAGN